MPTRAVFEKRIVNRCGPLMDAVGMAVTMLGVDNPNLDLDDAIAWSFGETSASEMAGDTPTDAELAGVSARNFNGKMLFLAEYRVLCTVRSRYVQTRIRVQNNEWFRSDLRDALDRRLAELEKMPVIKNAVAIQPLVAGGITLGGMFEEADTEDGE